MLLKLAANVLTYISQTLLCYWIFYFKMRKSTEPILNMTRTKRKIIQQSALAMQNVLSRRLMSETKAPLVMSG